LTIKPESSKRVLEAYDEAFKLLGQPNFTSGMKYICQELKKQLNFLSAISTRNGLEARLAKQPEPSSDQLEALIGGIRLIPYHLRKATIEAAKTLPHPPGGRPRVLTPQDGKEICAEIGALIGQGVTLSNAVKRMAQRYEVGEITIRRVWQKRGKPGVEVEFPKPKPDGGNNAG
jgi:hypothetical protein